MTVAVANEFNSAAMADVEDRLAAMIPEHRHELVRVIVDRDMACLETTIVSPTTHEYAPACVWWWLDDSGKLFGAYAGLGLLPAGQPARLPLQRDAQLV